jgi:hypothetical protein
MRWIRFASVLALALGACADPPLGSNPDLVQHDFALGRTIERDLRAPVQTDSLVYHLTKTAQMYSARIPFEYRNGTGDAIAIVNCHGGLNIGLEKRVAGTWQPFYWPILLECLSPPITIARGALYTNTASIYGALPGSNIFPAFATPDLNGEYRLVWSGLVHNYDDGKRNFGDPVGPLPSNPFLLVAPD